MILFFLKRKEDYKNKENRLLIENNLQPILEFYRKKVKIIEVSDSLSFDADDLVRPLDTFSSSTQVMTVLVPDLVKQKIINKDESLLFLRSSYPFVKIPTIDMFLNEKDKKYVCSGVGGTQFVKSYLETNKVKIGVSSYVLNDTLLAVNLAVAKPSYMVIETDRIQNLNLIDDFSYDLIRNNLTFFPIKTWENRVLVSYNG
jgi:hypothetical protein